MEQKQHGDLEQRANHGHHDHASHDHHHRADSENYEGIEVSHHEGAIILSVERVITGEYELVRDTLSRELKILADWVEEQGGIVGHIKAFLAENGYTSMLSTTGGEVQIKESRKPKVVMKLAVIAFINDERKIWLKFAESLEKLKF